VTIAQTNKGSPTAKANTIPIPRSLCDDMGKDLNLLKRFIINSRPQSLPFQELDYHHWILLSIIVNILKMSKKKALITGIQVRTVVTSPNFCSKRVMRLRERSESPAIWLMTISAISRTSYV